VDIRLTRVQDSATAVCAKTFTTDITVTVPASNVQVADIFRTGSFH
jgi:hypothetical protein